MGPAKDKHGVRESFAKVTFFIREEWPFRDEGILIKTHVCMLKDVKLYTFNINV